MDRLIQLHQVYNAIRQALPWLDCYVSDIPCAFEDGAQVPPTPFRKLDFETTNPRLVRQTDHSFEEIEAMAAAHPEVNYVIVSGERKLLYHFDVLERLLVQVPNLYVATSNLCNEFGLERLIEAGAGAKLLYGSMMPCLDAGNTLGMIVLGRMSWKDKCDIAGNNFRRLLGEEPVYPAEIAIPEIAPFAIDAHTHTTGDDIPHRFPPYQAIPVWSVWKDKINRQWVDGMFTIPDEALIEQDRMPSSRSLVKAFCQEAQGKAYYMEVFDPNHVEETVEALELALAEPLCVGIKIHPVEHHIMASDPRYDIPFQKAALYGKPIMTHSWGISSYNPNQRYATPKEFEVWLAKYPQVPFVFGHTGGRPNGFVEVVELMKKYPQCYCDLAGDVFHNGFLLHAIRDIGAERILFASDSYWIDQRSMMGMLFESGLSVPELWKIFHLNALKVYHPQNHQL